MACDLFRLDADIALAAEALRAEQIEHGVRQTGMPCVDLDTVSARSFDRIERTNREYL